MQARGHGEDHVSPGRVRRKANPAYIKVSCSDSILRDSYRQHAVLQVKRGGWVVNKAVIGKVLGFAHTHVYTPPHTHTYIV